LRLTRKFRAKTIPIGAGAVFSIFFAAIATFIQAEEIISIGVRHAASAYQHVSRIAYYLLFKTIFLAFPFGVNFEVKHGSE